MNVGLRLTLRASCLTIRDTTWEREWLIRSERHS
jgi:hypothetical protein